MDDAGEDQAAEAPIPETASEMAPSTEDAGDEGDDDSSDDDDAMISVRRGLFGR